METNLCEGKTGDPGSGYSVFLFLPASFPHLFLLLLSQGFDMYCGKLLLLLRTKSVTNESLRVNKRWVIACISEAQGVGWFCGQDDLIP